MQRKLRYLTWQEFDDAVEHIANQFKGKATQIYGMPRGGLCLAVALSHKMEIPLISVDVTTFKDFNSDNVLWVDDVVETGLTLSGFGYPNMYFACWFLNTKVFKNICFKESLKENEWLVFPWEDKTKAIKDMKQYEISRK